MAYDYSGRSLSHAYILAAPAEQQRRAEADRLAAAMLCESADARPCGTCRHCRKVLGHIHPDVIQIEREVSDKGIQKREIYVDQIRDVVMDLSVLPNEAGKKVYIIHDAGTMNASAQNALLKGLEEPPAFVSFILCAENGGSLLETVRSRCVELRIRETETAEDHSELTLQYLQAAADGRPEKLLRFCAAQESMDNAAALDFTADVKNALIDYLCGRLAIPGLDRERAMELVRLMDRANDYLRVNVGVKHVFGLLAVQTK